MATVVILQKGRSKSQHIMPLVRRLTMCAASNNFIVVAKHVPGKLNTIADSLSRLQLERFRRLAPHADVHPQQIPYLQDIFWNYDQWSRNFGTPP